MTMCSQIFCSSTRLELSVFYDARLALSVQRTMLQPRAAPHDVSARSECFCNTKSNASFGACISFVLLFLARTHLVGLLCSACRETSDY